MKKEAGKHLLAQKSIADEVVHFSDYRFSQWCLTTYTVNRGVYNSIEERLYELGYLHIVQRRLVLIAFLDYLKEIGYVSAEKRFLTFGKGGLNPLLHQFLKIKGLEYIEALA